MYKSFFNFTEFPFQITPDSRFFFGQGPHKKALAYATYGLNKGEGFVVITGEVGAGKTTLVNYLLSHLLQNERPTANIVSTKLEAENLIKMVATAFGLPCTDDDKATILRKIEHFLLNQRNTRACGLLIVDEVQNLSLPSLEELRMLSNFQRQHSALLQIFLVGQPEFRETMLQPSMEQLRQRVVASFHLGSLDAAQTREYIEHRLRKVGWRLDPRFDPLCFPEIHRASSGIPRRINLLCDRLLVSSFLAGRHDIDPADVNEVVLELREEKLIGPPREQKDNGELGVSSARNGTARSNGPIDSQPLDSELQLLARRLGELDHHVQDQERRLEEILERGLPILTRE